MHQTATSSGKIQGKAAQEALEDMKTTEGGVFVREIAGDVVFATKVATDLEIVEQLLLGIFIQISYQILMLICLDLDEKDLSYICTEALSYYITKSRGINERYRMGEWRNGKYILIHQVSIVLIIKSFFHLPWYLRISITPA